MSVLPKDEVPFDINFLDSEQTVVEVRYSRPNNCLEGFMIRMDDPSDEDYVRLFSEFTTLEELQRKAEVKRKADALAEERIADFTSLHEEINRLKQIIEDNDNWKSTADNWKKKALTVKGGERVSREKVVYKDQDIVEVLKKNLNKEQLFAMKISLFEDPKIRNSSDKEAKSKIRKATSALEVLASAAPLLLAPDPEEDQANSE